MNIDANHRPGSKGILPMKLPTWPYTSLLRTVAERYRCHELAAFDVNPFGRTTRQRLHLRPGDELEEENRLDVQQAFREIADRCVGLDRDGAVVIEDSEVDGKPLYCLVLLSRQETTVVGVVCYIVRVANVNIARAMLSLMRDELDDFLEQSPMRSAA